MVAGHLVAHARLGVRSLLVAEHAVWLWARLRSNLPDALSVVFMPDHVHVVARAGQRAVFVRVLAAFTGLFGIRFDVLPAEPARSPAIAARMVRYGFYNPVRAGLADDPWAWRFSTLRDLAGAAHPIWTPAAGIARSLAIPQARLIETLTTTADHRPSPPREHPKIAANLPALREAVAAALRVADTNGGRARRLIVQAAHAIALPGVRRLADELGCSARTVFRDRAARDPALDAVLLCLGDARLLRGAVPEAAVPSDPATVGRRGWQAS